MPDTVAVPDTIDGHAQEILDGLVAFKNIQALAELFLHQDEYFDSCHPYAEAIRVTARVVLEEITSDNGCDSWDVDYAIKHALELVSLVQMSRIKESFDA